MTQGMRKTGHYCEVTAMEGRPRTFVLIGDEIDVVLHALETADDLLSEMAEDAECTEEERDMASQILSDTKSLMIAMQQEEGD